MIETAVRGLTQYGVAGAVVLLALVLLIILIISGVMRGRRRRYPYQALPSLFSAAELRFLRALEKAVDKRVRIYAKVRIADVVRVSPKVDRSRFFRAFNAIACKHLDYVLCEAESCAILAAIELDDRSHDRPDRRKRDAFVDAVMQAAGIPLLHIPARARYDVRELKATLQKVLATA
ncbi:MAG: DUF2726 domain-containing protein [Gammaproteobacteria bacterium]